MRQSENRGGLPTDRYAVELAFGVEADPIRTYP
jgi:hypothetical protein